MVPLRIELPCDVQCKICVQKWNQLRSTDVENVKWHKMYIITFIIISDWFIADAFAHW